MLKKALAAAAIVYFLAAAAAAQDAGRFDVSAAYGAVFGHTSTSSLVNVSVVSTNSALVLGTIRYRFNWRHGFEVNYGRTLDSQIFMTPPGEFRVQTTVSEYSGAYVFRPVQLEKLAPFLLAGGGALAFNPGNTYINGFLSPFGAARQTSLAFLYGGGFDYPVRKRWALRLEYRGLVYKQPNFHLQQFVTNVRGHAPTASIGIVFGF